MLPAVPLVNSSSKSSKRSYRGKISLRSSNAVCHPDLPLDHNWGRWRSQSYKDKWTLIGCVSNTWVKSSSNCGQGHEHNSNSEESPKCTFRDQSARRKGALPLLLTLRMGFSWGWACGFPYRLRSYLLYTPIWWSGFQESQLFQEQEKQLKTRILLNYWYSKRIWMIL